MEEMLETIKVNQKDKVIDSSNSHKQQARKFNLKFRRRETVVSQENLLIKEAQTDLKQTDQTDPKVWHLGHRETINHKEAVKHNAKNMRDS